MEYDYMFSFLSNSQRILVIAIMILGLMWVLELFFLTKLSGKMKRGFKIWSKPLSNELRESLANPAKTIIEPHRYRGTIFYSFIISENNEVIICSYPRTFIPCVAYVNLKNPKAKLEYRGGISHFFVIVLALVYATYLVIPVFALILTINYWVEIRSIDNFLSKKIT